MEESIFNDSTDERVKMAEIITLDWMGQHWEQIENMLESIRSHTENTILVNYSTLKAHQEKISEVYKTTNNTFSRLTGYTYHSEDFFPNTKCPLSMMNDPDIECILTRENTLIDSIVAESKNTVFIVIQTTKDLGSLHNFGNLYWIYLPKIVLKQDTLYKTNCVGEVASLILFGELRFRGIYSHLWSNFNYNELENLSNRRFAHIVRENIVSPFYLSPKISKDAVFMGLRFEEYKPQIVKRKLSPVRRKILKSKPNITRPPSPDRKPRIIRPPSPDRKPKRSLSEEKEDKLINEKEKNQDTEEPIFKEEEDISTENTNNTTEEKEEEDISTENTHNTTEEKEEEDISTENTHNTTEEKEEEDISTENTHNTTEEKEEDISTKKVQHKTTRKMKKTIINPKTGRKIVVGGGTYINLVEKGIIEEDSFDETS